MSQSKHLSTIVTVLLLIISCSIYNSKKSILQLNGDVEVSTRTETSSNVNRFKSGIRKAQTIATATKPTVEVHKSGKATKIPLKTC